MHFIHSLDLRRPPILLRVVKQERQLASWRPSWHPPEKILDWKLTMWVNNKNLMYHRGRGYYIIKIFIHPLKISLGNKMAPTFSTKNVSVFIVTSPKMIWQNCPHFFMLLLCVCRLNVFFFLSCWVPVKRFAPVGFLD